MKDKIKAIWKILNSNSFALISSQKKGIHTIAWSDKELNLEREMLVATTLMRLYDALIKDIEKKAIDAGEANSLLALSSVVDKLRGAK